MLLYNGINLYHAGDTSKIDEMKQLGGMNITYALLPMDGVDNIEKFNVDNKIVLKPGKVIELSTK